MALPYTTAVSAQPYRNNGGTILKGGNGANTEFDSLTELSNANSHKGYGSVPFAPTGVNSSGNIGARLAKNGGTFALKMSEGQFIAMVMGTTINGSASNLMKIPAADYSQRRDVNSFVSYQRLHITSWNAVTGAATKGAQNGTSVQASGIDGTVGRNADTSYGTDAIPAKFVYLTKLSPTSVNQDDRTNP